jgi:hypothetical protein
MIVRVVLTTIVIALCGCQSPRTRLAANPEAAAKLDPATREKIARGEVEVGFTADMVSLAMGRPVRVIAPTTPGGDTVWLYHDGPRNENDYVRAGFRRRVVFDPERRANVVIIEPVGDRIFPALRSHTIRVRLRADRVVGIDSVEDP